MVIATNVPSPWSQAALGLFDMKGLDYLAVRFRRSDEEIKRWTGARNVPAVLLDDEPPRTGWADIVTLAERLGGKMSLVPEDDERRVRMFGLSHEILGEGGLGWSVRLLLTHASFATDGREGWPKPVADYLAPRYGYAPERVAAARARAIAVLRLLDAGSRRAARAATTFLGRRDGARRSRGGRPGRDRAAAGGTVPHAGASSTRVRDPRSGSEGGRFAGAARAPGAHVRAPPGAAGPLVTVAAASCRHPAERKRPPPRRSRRMAGDDAGSRGRRREGREARVAFAETGEVTGDETDGIVVDDEHRRLGK